MQDCEAEERVYDEPTTTVVTDDAEGGLGKDNRSCKCTKASLIRLSWTTWYLSVD